MYLENIPGCNTNYIYTMESEKVFPPKLRYHENSFRKAQLVQKCLQEEVLIIFGDLCDVYFILYAYGY